MVGFVKFRAGADWVPFLVTHVTDGDIVSGVAFSGQPERHGWNRPVGNFALVHRGSGDGQWLPLSEEDRAAYGIIEYQSPPQSDADALPIPEVTTAPIPPQPPGDDLTRLSGVGPAAATWLRGEGLRTYAALASLTDEQIEYLGSAEGSPSSVTAENLTRWRSAAKRE